MLGYILRHDVFLGVWWSVADLTSEKDHALTTLTAGWGMAARTACGKEKACGNSK